MPKQVRPDLTLFEVGKKDAIHAPCQQPGEVGLAHAERQLPDVLAITDQTVESIKLHFVIVLSAVQAVEVGDAVNAEQYSFAVDHKRVVSISKGGLDDERKAVGPIVPVASEQA